MEHSGEKLIVLLRQLVFVTQRKQQNNYLCMTRNKLLRALFKIIVFEVKGVE